MVQTMGKDHHMETQADAKRQRKEVATLKELVAYQEGTVVSRTLMKRPSGTVTLFAFDQGEGLSEHTAPFDALVYLIDGQADIDIAGHTFRLQVGEIITLPANRPHALRAVSRFKMLLIMLRS
jgi:quercetin dioxygenase-like cupin family protein